MKRTIVSAIALAFAFVLATAAARADYTPLIYQGVFDNASTSTSEGGDYRYTQSGRYDRRTARSSSRAVTAPRQAHRRAAPGKAAFYSRPRPVVRHARQAPAARVGGHSGMASYYWQGQRVASGGVFNPHAMTAAHRSLPFGTRVRVTNARTGRSVNVTINDRGPFVAGRIIDLSLAAAGAIGMRGAGVAPVRLEVLGR